LILFAFGNKHIADWTIEYSFYVTSAAAVIVLPCVASLFTDQCFQAIYCSRHVVEIRLFSRDVPPKFEGVSCEITISTPLSATVAPDRMA
jgi:hypothetical protein